MNPLLSRSIKLMALLFSTFLVFGCTNNESNTDDFGYIQFYNASQNSPKLYLTVEDSLLAGSIYSEASARTQITSGDNDLTISWQEDANNEVEIFDDQISVTDGDVSLIVVAGDFESPDILTFKYEHDPDSLTDETDEDNYVLRVLNAAPNSNGVDIYLSADDETFNEAVLVASEYYGELSDPNYFATDGYKIYMTNSGSSEPVYESDTVYFYNNDEYVLVVRPNTGSDSAPYTLDMITSLTSVEYPPVNAQADVRFYNGLNVHELLPQLNESVDVELISDSPVIKFENLSYGSISNQSIIAPDDYAINIYPASDNTPIAENHFMSLSNNQSSTVFLYHTEVTEEDSDGNETTNLYINSLVLDDSQRESLYDHAISIVNLVQDDDFNSVKVYFVKSDETVETASYAITASRASVRSILLPNNTFDVKVIATINQSDILLSSSPITLNSDSGDLYLIIREDLTSPTGYKLDFISQNSDG